MGWIGHPLGCPLSVHVCVHKKKAETRNYMDRVLHMLFDFACISKVHDTLSANHPQPQQQFTPTDHHFDVEDRSLWFSCQFDLIILGCTPLMLRKNGRAK